MNLLDAFKQYIRDAMPGGALNPEVTTQGVLDAAALGTAPVPVLGDAIGLAADVKRLKDNPGERTPMNFGLAALGALPFVPGLSGIVQGGKVADALNAKHGAKLDAYIMEGDKLHLSKVVVPKDARNAGAGTDFMRDLVSAADKQGKTVTLTPSSDFGGNKARLEQFYKRFGFVPNKGRTKDYEISEAMYRLPQQPTPSVLRPPQADALETARKNAVTMLGLPPNNTPMDRAKALGFVDDAYHGTSADIRSFNTAGRGKTSGSGAFFTDNPNVASTYASSDGGNVIPVMIRSDFPVNVMANGSNWNWLGKGVKVDGPKTPTNKATKKTLGKLFPDFFRYEDALSTDDVARWSSGQGYDATVFNAVKDRGPNGVFHTSDAALPSKNTAVFNPANIRSRFAAFDPARINENDLLGRADLGLLGLLAGGAAGAAYLTSDKDR